MPTYGIDQGDIEWDVPANAWASPNYCAAGPVPRNGCSAPISRTPSPTPVHCLYCRARVGHQRNYYAAACPHLCTFFEDYFRARTKRAADAILEKDALRRNKGLRERPPLPPTTIWKPAERAAKPPPSRPYPPFRPGEREELARRVADREWRQARSRRNAFAARAAAQPYSAEAYRPWMDKSRKGRV